MDQAAARTGAGWLEVELTAAELAQRLAEQPPRGRPIPSKWLRRYAYLVTSAHTGAVLRDPAGDQVPAASQRGPVST